MASNDTKTGDTVYVTNDEVSPAGSKAPTFSEPGQGGSDIEDKGDLWDGGKVELEPTVLDDPLLGQYYRPRDDYEGAHRFDPSATWTEQEEKKLVRKIDLRIMAWWVISFGDLVCLLLT